MSREIEIIRLAYQSYEQRSVSEAFRAHAADGFQFHSRAGFPGPETFGAAEMEALWADLDETFVEYRLVPVDYAMVNGNVLVEIETGARLPGSDAHVSAHMFHLWRFAGGKVTSARTYTDRDEAVRAAESGEA